ncbi:MAG: hypothetical protein RLZZ383_455, partial [Pseudomonadota bacterium]
MGIRLEFRTSCLGPSGCAGYPWPDPLGRGAGWAAVVPVTAVAQRGRAELHAE